MKKIVLVLLLFCLFGCSTSNLPVEPVSTPEETLVDPDLFPIKEDPESALMGGSPINPKNIDSYLFREDCIYLDTRSPEQFYSEGSIGGFINLPFYGYIADFNNKSGALFTMTKVTDEDGSVYPLGEPGSFIANFEESEELIKDLIPDDKNILIIATAGVESCYLINLLIQLGYNGSQLYNVGSFTTGMGDDIAYISYPDARHLVPPFELYETTMDYSWKNLTPSNK